MNKLSSAILAAWMVLCPSIGHAQGTEPKPVETAAPAQAASEPDQAHPPPAVIAATSDKATVTLLMRDQKQPPLAADFSTGLITSTQPPPLVSRPAIEAVRVTGPAGADNFTVELDIEGLFAFGDSDIPVLHKGVLVETFRFSRPGLVVKPAFGEGFTLREGWATPLVLVLDNPAGFAYTNVRARLRFDGIDVCAFETERFGAVQGSRTASCAEPADWSLFEVPRYARVTLRAIPPTDWFLDPKTGLASKGDKKGVLTLRFQDGSDGPIHEQNLPLEVRFEPRSWSLLWSMGWVAVWLLAGAVFSLLLRISVPNMKRKRQLRDQLGEAAKLISLISTEVDSNLRVLLRVERLALDEIRQEGLAVSPDYADFAQRVELALPMLKRRIEAVRRLDATLVRRRLMLEQGPSPSRLEQVEERLSSVSEMLKQDSLSEEDWVLVNQRLETAQKIMREPTQTEKEAFEALLSGRWKAIRKHFGNAGLLEVPQALHGLAPCFPDRSLLPVSDNNDPERDDPDGSKWIQDVGPVRADLQLCALSMAWEFEFLVPSRLDRNIESHGRWFDAMDQLNRLLATPAVSNLREAKQLLRRLAEGVSEAQIEQALTTAHATIVMDPALPRPNQKIRFSVRLRPDQLGCAAARDLVTCRWTFGDRHVSSGVNWISHHWSIPESTPASARVRVLHETGWDVHHYFEKDIDQSQIKVEFYNSKGEPIGLGKPADPPDVPPWHQPVVEVTVSRRSNDKRGRVVSEVVQVGAALLVPLATLASTTLGGGGGASWWELIAIGFASDTIKNVLVGLSTASTASTASNTAR